MPITWYELRDARAMAGKSQAELARNMGVSIRSVQNYEKPGSTIPLKGEHGIWRVLRDELELLRELREKGTYESTATSSLPAGLVAEPSQPAPLQLDPRLAGISRVEMLRELLAREEREYDYSASQRAVVVPPADDVEIAEGLPRLTKSQVADLQKDDLGLAAQRRTGVEAEQEGSAEG